MIIITKKKAYTWNYKRFAKHLLYLVVGVAWLWAFFHLSNLDYLDAIK